MAPDRPAQDVESPLNAKTYEPLGERLAQGKSAEVMRTLAAGVQAKDGRALAVLLNAAAHCANFCNGPAAVTVAVEALRCYLQEHGVGKLVDIESLLKEVQAADLRLGARLINHQEIVERLSKAAESGGFDEKLTGIGSKITGGLTGIANSIRGNMLRIGSNVPPAPEQRHTVISDEDSMRLQEAGMPNTGSGMAYAVANLKTGEVNGLAVGDIVAKARAQKLVPLCLDLLVRAAEFLAAQHKKKTAEQWLGSFMEAIPDATQEDVRYALLSLGTNNATAKSAADALEKEHKRKATEAAAPPPPAALDRPRMKLPNSWMVSPTFVGRIEDFTPKRLQSMQWGLHLGKSVAALLLTCDLNADGKTIDSAYRGLAQRYHPDSFPNNEYTKRVFAFLAFAYEVAKDGKGFETMRGNIEGIQKYMAAVPPAQRGPDAPETAAKPQKVTTQVALAHDADLNELLAILDRAEAAAREEKIAMAMRAMAIIGKLCSAVHAQQEILLKTSNLLATNQERLTKILSA